MKNLVCRIFGHRYRFHQRISPTIWVARCKRCRVYFGVHEEVKTVLQLDDELRKLHAEILKDNETKRH